MLIQIQAVFQNLGQGLAYSRAKEDLMNTCNPSEPPWFYGCMLKPVIHNHSV